MGVLRALASSRQARLPPRQQEQAGRGRARARQPAGATAGASTTRRGLVPSSAAPPVLLGGCKLGAVRCTQLKLSLSCGSTAGALALAPARAPRCTLACCRALRSPHVEQPALSSDPWHPAQPYSFSCLLQKPRPARQAFFRRTHPSVQACRPPASSERVGQLLAPGACPERDLPLR